MATGPTPQPTRFTLTVPTSFASIVPVRRLRNQGGLLLVIPVLLLIFSLLPLGTALEFGGDEGYELMKGFLCSKGYVLYKDIWNDQPPLFTLLLSNAFKIWGPSLLAARLIAAGFGMVLFVAFYQLIRQRLGQRAALLAVFFLLAAPAVLGGSVSVMLEVPAIGTALVSAWCMFQWRNQRHWGWLVASGLVMGLALEIKLTAVMVAPAMLMEIALAQPTRRGSLRPVLLNLLSWGATVVLIFLAIALLWGRGSYETSLKSHLTSHAIVGLSSPNDFRFKPNLFWLHYECVATALIGIFLVFKQRRWRELSFPLVLLATALGIHTFHRPWWTYYYLHLAVPLAWLAGFAAHEIIRNAGKFLSAGRSRYASTVLWKGMALSVLIALTLALTEVRLESHVRVLRKTPLASDSPVLAKMREYAGRTHWVYSQPVIYPFHAGLPVPPELGVVVLKRFWSGQITTEEIVETCHRYQPEQLLLYPDRIGDDWKDLLQTGYDLAYQGTNCLLYVAKTTIR